MRTRPCYGSLNNCYRLTATGAGAGGAYTWYRSFSGTTGTWGTPIGTGAVIDVPKGWFYMVVGRDANGCTNTSTTSAARSDESVTVNPEAIIDLTNVDSEVGLFPNPNDGNMTLTYAIGVADKGTFTLYNMLGQTIAIYPLDGTNTLLQINNDQLSNGTYVYNVVINGTEVKRDKIIVVR